MKIPKKLNRSAGFALIVTLSLMILLTVIAVGLLTLSSISLRASGQGASLALAKSNAKLALMLAIGDLQKSLGPDRRISANAGSFDVASPQPNLVGVWDGFGWQGPSSTTPPAPSDKASKFRRWLASVKNDSSAVDFSYSSGEPGQDVVWLSTPATTGTIAPNDTTLRAQRVAISVGSDRGGFAWMVSDNSTKASLNLPSSESLDLAKNVANRTAVPAPQPSVLDKKLEKITDPARIISLQTAVLAIGPENEKEITARSQSLTTSSRGLLTDPVNGGLKADLTSFLNSTAPTLVSPLGETGPYFPSTSTTGDGAPTWDYLRSHYQLYKRVTGQPNGKPRYRPIPGNDYAPSRLGLKTKPPKEILLPVIAKLQIMFSLVSHPSHIDDRIKAFNDRASPPGNALHAVPHLVYDPIITLYNPYDVELELNQLRIRVSDPPVGFQFQKNEASGGNYWYRQEFASGQFQGLGRFQIKNEHDTNARKTFTYFLRAKTNGKPGGSIILLPGEVKVFSAWVEDTWTWRLETGTGYSPRSFFDWNYDNNMGNQDLRTLSSSSGGTGRFGVESVPGLDWRAGLQTDHLSYGSGRDLASMYSWEKNSQGTAKADPLGAGWLSMKLSDSVTVNAKPQRCVANSTEPDFKVDIMAGLIPDANSDILRTYEFRLGDVATEMATTADTAKVIRRKFKNQNILQTPDDPSPGGKSPFAIFTMSAKTTKDKRDDSKAWLQNNMVTEGGSHDSRRIGNAAQSYDLRLEEVQDFTNFPGVEYDDKLQRGYFGAKATSQDGVSVVPMYRVPITPAASLGDWIASNLVTSSQFPRVNYTLGNSFAHPLIPSGQIFANSPMGGGARMLDHAYLMNAALWDRYYFSTATDYENGAFVTKRTKAEVLKDFFKSEAPMLNTRLIAYRSGGGDPEAMAKTYTDMSATDFSKKFAANAMILGAFNVNSDSVDAWRAVLSSMRDKAVKGYANQELTVTDKTAFVRNGLPVAGSADNASPQNSVNALGQIRWAGFRALTDDQIKELSERIVEEIRARAKEDSAPSLCVADFVNRRIGTSSGLHALKGILQTAIDRSKINETFQAMDSKVISGGSLAANRVTGLANKAALDGFTGDGAAPMLSQGDLLTGLAPIITARGDTFTIRSYGEARNSNGTAVVARAWCEATVQRIPEYVDPTNAPETNFSELLATNMTFGRRFVITSFRWLTGSDI